MQQYFIDKFVNTFSKIEKGSMQLATPDGKQHNFTGEQSGTHGHMTIHNSRTIPVFAAKGDIGLAETYRDGWWDSDNLAELFQMGLENEKPLWKYIYGNPISRFVTKILYYFTRNSLKGSKRNIHAHYDLGNDFYSLWLDPSMSYSSAIFDKNIVDDTLENAQHRKYDRMLDCLEKTSGSILEIGCGWGGLAERACQKGDFDFKGITISKQQYEYAKQLLSGRANIAYEDYRHQTGKYDFILSIEMFEAVGEKYWPVYFNKIKEHLAADGKAVIQTITIADAYFEAYRNGGDMIRSFIFPGGMLPSVTRFSEEAQKAGLKITNKFFFGLDYARTLTMWLEAFNENIETVKRMDFDEEFIRIWRFYLTCCIASFNVRRTDVMQIEMTHA